ncbi:MAG: hypothetical protein ACQ9ET_05855 [Nitrosomonadaceae bacterium]
MKTLTAKQKWIYSSSAVALLSMFLPWFVWGMRSDNGWMTDYYVLLACWFAPLISAYSDFNWKVINIISLSIGSLAFVAFVGDTESITLFGDTYSSKVGAGVYVYLLAWSAAAYSVLMVPNGNYDANGFSGNAMPVSTNEELFLQVDRDFENNKIDEALWIKSLTICDGDKDKAKFKYIRDKVSKLEQEVIINNKNKKTTFSNKTEEFIKKLSVSGKDKTIDKDEALKKSKYSMILGVLSILCMFFIPAIYIVQSFINADSIDNGSRSTLATYVGILVLGAVAASIGGLVLGVKNIKNKQGISKRMSIIGIVMSSLVLAYFLFIIMFGVG